jgi:serine/threonine-protein kinase
MGKSSIIDIDGYRILRKLGSGARTTIYLAVDEDTRQTVALKRAVMEGPEDSRIIEQIEKEYKVARQIEHPYIRKCYKIFRIRKLLRTQEILLSMEYFDGQSLEEQQRLSLGDVLLIFRMVAIGLNAMHEKGFVHCDIKPNNILFNRQEGIKIIDLGQSCRIGEIKKRIQGTPDYIAPEQVRREHISHRTDIFNLGATMYWALTGRNVPTLIPKKNEFGIIVSDKSDFKSPHQLYPKIPVELSDLVMECVQDKPADRPSSMSEIVERLDILIRAIFGSKISLNASGKHPTLSNRG